MNNEQAQQVSPLVNEAIEKLQTAQQLLAETSESAPFGDQQTSDLRGIIVELETWLTNNSPNGQRP